MGSCLSICYFCLFQYLIINYHVCNSYIYVTRVACLSISFSPYEWSYDVFFVNKMLNPMITNMLSYTFLVLIKCLNVKLAYVFVYR